MYFARTPAPARNGSAAAPRTAGATLARAGFTLVEILVTIVILSVIAVVAVPIVIQQSGRADPVRVAHDFASIRTAIDLFHLQTRTAYPGRLDHLIEQITASDVGVDGTTFSSGQVTGWSGPYLDPALSGPGGTIRTGSDVDIYNFVELFDADLNTVTGSPAAADFVAVSTFQEMTPATFEAVNDIIDGPDEPDGYGPGFSSHTGRFRMVPQFVPITTTNVSGFAYYLARPF